MKSLPRMAAVTLAGALTLAGCSGGSTDSAGDPTNAASASVTPAEPVKADVWERPADYMSSDATQEGWESYSFYDGRISFQAPAGWAAEQSDLISTVTAPDEAASITILYATEAKAASVGGTAPEVNEAAAKKQIELYETGNVAPADIRGATKGFYLTADKLTIGDDDSHVGSVLFELPDTGEEASGFVQISQTKPIESETLNAILASVVAQ